MGSNPIWNSEFPLSTHHSIFIYFISDPYNYFAGDISTIGLKDCGSVVDDILTSPGYPDAYSNQMNCVYNVSIQHGKALKIKFQNFDLESASSCR